jgi:hypothetical protein
MLLLTTTGMQCGVNKQAYYKFRGVASSVLLPRNDNSSQPPILGGIPLNLWCDPNCSVVAPLNSGTHPYSYLRGGFSLIVGETFYSVCDM